MDDRTTSQVVNAPPGWLNRSKENCPPDVKDGTAAYEGSDLRVSCPASALMGPKRLN